MSGLETELSINLPSWVSKFAAQPQVFDSDHSKARLVLELATQNIDFGGGPFGAAIFDRGTHRMVSCGVNLVRPQRNSTLHAEMVAIMFAQKYLGRHTLSESENGSAKYELFASCEPCAMCLGACLWSGVSRIVCCAKGEDARSIGFDEGPVFDKSFLYLESRGIEIVRGFMQEQGKAILDSYLKKGGIIY